MCLGTSPHLCLNFSELVMHPGVDDMMTTVLFVIALALLYPIGEEDFETGLGALLTQLA